MITDRYRLFLIWFDIIAANFLLSGVVLGLLGVSLTWITLYRYFNRVYPSHYLISQNTPVGRFMFRFSFWSGVCWAISGHMAFDYIRTPREIIEAIIK